MTYLNKKNFVKAVKFIHDNLDKPIALNDIAQAANLSVSTLKRLFLEATNHSAGAFVRRLRMERAFRTLKNKEDSVLEVALSSGFEDHSAFARSFKESFGYSPTFARKKLNLVREFDCISLEEPEIIEISEIPLQLITKQGLYFESAPRAWDALKACLGTLELGDDFAGTFIGIGHDNPHDGEIAEDQVRFSAGITFCDHDLCIEKFTLHAGTYAKFKYTGKPNNLGLAYHYIYGVWLEKSEMKIHIQRPAFMMYDKFPDGFEEKNIAIYIPLAP